MACSIEGNGGYGFMKTGFYILILIANLVSLQALAQDKKVKVTVIEFSDSDRVQKTNIEPQVKQAAAKQNFEATKIDAEILSLDEQLEKGVVYLQ